MKLFPDLDDFSKLYNQGKSQIIWTEFIADMETPVSAFLKTAADRPYSFLLESVEGGAVMGRYSIIGMNPDILWKCNGNHAEINLQAFHDPDTFNPVNDDPLTSLRSLLVSSKVDHIPEDLPPMISSGLFGYLGYDMIRQIEDIPDSNPDPLNMDDAIMMRPTALMVFDNILHKLTIATIVYTQDTKTADTAYEEAKNRLEIVVNDLMHAPFQRKDTSTISRIDPQSNITREEFHDMVKKGKEYILAGDIFQVVLGQRFSFKFDLPAFNLYRSLRRLNPSPFLFFLNFPDSALVGSSPEILVRVRDNKVTLRPIAGTRKRGATPAEDKELEADLLNDPKELAEHLMLLDLGRNDVGRIAEIGSVEVTESFETEYYSHVMHIVSSVEGTLRNDKDILEALFSGFPAGTTSGAPKIRAMEIIDELETIKRKFYAGCVGYLGANGDLDTCIALRTAFVKDGHVHVQAGGGVVADSDPEAEYQESCNKARAIIAAAEDAIELSKVE